MKTREQPWELLASVCGPLPIAVLAATVLEGGALLLLLLLLARSGGGAAASPVRVLRDADIARSPLPAEARI
jgi:hypothetical protein